MIKLKSLIKEKNVLNEDAAALMSWISNIPMGSIVGIITMLAAGVWAAEEKGINSKTVKDKLKDYWDKITKVNPILKKLSKDTEVKNFAKKHANGGPVARDEFFKLMSKKLKPNEYEDLKNINYYNLPAVKQIINQLQEGTLLKEELNNFPGDTSVIKLLKGYEKYSHDHNAVGFWNDNGKVSISDLDAILKKFYTPKSRGAKMYTGLKVWSYTKPFAPYYEYYVKFDTMDGKTVRNFYINISKA